MNFLRKLFYGRYGFKDALSITLLIAFFVLFILYKILDVNSLFFPLLLILLIYAYYRGFSKNIQKRYNENAAFVNFFRRIKNFFKLRYMIIRDRKTYRYAQCNTCKQISRVPVNKGTVLIKCRKCGNSFKIKT